MPLYPQLNVSVPAIQAPAFWSAYSRGTGESVGVLDSGVMNSNSGFTGLNIVSQVFLAEGSTDSCFGDDLTATDHLGHGTHVGGIVASQGGGTCVTCVGVSPGLDTLYALKIGWLVSGTSPCKGGGEAYDGDVVDAIEWALNNTAVNVFNFSYGGSPSGDDDSLCQVFDQIGDTWGVNIVIAAGNSGASGVNSPGISYNGVTVASMDDKGTVSRSDDTISSFSSRGPTSSGRRKPDISAPGNHNGNGLGGILSTCNSGSFCSMAGTSMATPHVAGSLALIRSAGGQDGLTAKAVLLNSAYSTQSGWQSDSGWGFVDLSAASQQAGNVLESSVTAAQPRFYSGSVTGDFKTTLVWNRHITGTYPYILTPSFSNLDLYAYDGTSGNLLGSSASIIQNVEQVHTTGTGAAVLKVAALSVAGGSSEKFALAFSTGGFATKNGPSLTVSCTGPSGTVLVNSTFTVPCTVTNAGDLTALAVSGTLNWQGSSGGTVNQFATLGAGQSSSPQSWQVTAPSTPGTYTMEADTSSSSWGQTFTGSTTFNVVVGQSYTLTTAVSPSGSGTVAASPSAAGGIYAAGTKVCLSATPNAGWTFGSWSGTALNGSNCLVLNANASVTATFTSITGPPADFNGDGHPDLIWQNDTNRQATVWYMGGTNGTTMLGWNYLSGSVPGWTIAGVADFNNDGHPDLIWQNDTTREATVWYMGGTNGTTMLGWNYLSGSVPGWTIAGVADFNNDGHPDLIWQNDTTREATVWYMGGTNGTTMLGWNYLSGSVPGWTIAGVADFNSDGHPDLIWQNDTTRQATVWYMGGTNGTTMLGWNYLSGSVPGWTIAGVADFDSDGHPDLIWQDDTSRQTTVWYMGGTQGTTMLGWSYLSGAVTGWKVVGTH